MATFHIKKNTERYPGIAEYWPNIILCEGTLEQAIRLAADLTSYQAGCDWAFYCVEDPEIDEGEK